MAGLHDVESVNSRGGAFGPVWSNPDSVCITRIAIVPRRRAEVAFRRVGKWEGVFRVLDGSLHTASSSPMASGSSYSRRHHVWPPVLSDVVLR